MAPSQGRPHDERSEDLKSVEQMPIIEVVMA